MAQQTIVAYFDSRSEAEAARTALMADGVSASAVTLLPEEGSTYTRESTETSYDVQSDRGGFWSSLGNLFLPDEDRYAYAEGLSRGGIALSVTTDDASYDRVADLLERSGADSIDERETQWRSEGWTGYAADATGTVGTAATGMAATGMAATGMAATGTASLGRDAAVTDDDGTIQVVEEQLRVGKRMAEGGRVRIRSYVVETPVEAQVELRSSRVTIERRPVDRAATAADFTTGDRTLEAHEHREEAMVSKEARVVEEIGLREESESHTETVSDTVRKTEVEVVDERTGEVRPGGTSQGTATTTRETTTRKR